MDDRVEVGTKVAGRADDAEAEQHLLELAETDSSLPAYVRRTRTVVGLFVICTRRISGTQNLIGQGTADRVLCVQILRNSYDGAGVLEESVSQVVGFREVERRLLLHTMHAASQRSRSAGSLFLN